MNCIKTEEKFDALLDGRLSDLEKQEVETHLKTCDACRLGFENLRAISQTLKQNSAVSAPARLDQKVFSAFEAFHNVKAANTTIKPTEKAVWLGIPRFVLAAALAFFALSVISAFQIGRMSATGGEIADTASQEKKDSSKDLAENNSEKSAPEKIVEVPVIREKIVEVPVITEKIVIRTVYVNKPKENAEKPDSTVPGQNNFALKSSVAENGYLTQTDLRGFQPVSEIKTKITKRSIENEK